MLLQAQSGHGKTAIFATAILNAIDTGKEGRRGGKEGGKGREGTGTRGMRQVPYVFPFSLPAPLPFPVFFPSGVPDKEAIQAIVLVPNRDLARQVTAEIESLGQYLDPPVGRGGGREGGREREYLEPPGGRKGGRGQVL